MEDLALVATVPVAKKKALFKSGPKKNKLRPGCRFKGKRVLCTPEVAARLNSASGGGRKASARRSPMNVTPKSPLAAKNAQVFKNLLFARSQFKVGRESGNCGLMRDAARAINEALQYMGTLPTKPTKRNPQADPRIRNRKYVKEIDRVKAETITSCSTRINPAQNASNRAQYEAFMRSQRPSPSAAREQAEVDRFNGLGKMGRKRR